MKFATTLLQRWLRMACHPVALVLVCAVGVLFAGNVENEWLSVPFAVSIVAVLAAMVFVLSKRPAFSIYLSWIIVGTLTLVSIVKYKLKGFSLHYYDAVFVAEDPEVYRFLFDSYLYVIVPVIVVLFLAVIASVLLFRADRRVAWPAWAGTSLLAVAVIMVPMTFPAEAAKERQFYYMQGRHLSAFFVSLLDLRNMFVQTDFEQRLQAMEPQKPFADTVACGDRDNLPDIFVVLSETQTDPAIFPQISNGDGFSSRFSPGVDNLRPMSVETFGGGTWITNLSLLTGLSSTDFGWRSPYLTISLENRIGGSLPQVLARCGYRTAVQLPMNYTFVNDGPFLRSIGFETIRDIDAIKAPFYHLRDDFYYRAAEAFIAEHRKTDGRPLFLEIETMFPHSPYEERLEPDIAVAGEPFSADFGVNEYMRRMAIARGDFQTFLDSRASQAAEHPSVVLEFGDHQSSATKELVDEIAGEGALAKPGSLAYRTYYTVTNFNHPMRRRMPEGNLDVAYVGASLLDAAGLPMTPMLADLVRLRDRCGGAFHTCADREAVDLHLRRRIDSGLLQLFPGAVGLRTAASGH